MFKSVLWLGLLAGGIPAITLAADPAIPPREARPDSIDPGIRVDPGPSPDPRAVVPPKENPDPEMAVKPKTERQEPLPPVVPKVEPPRDHDKPAPDLPPPAVK
jgi:hypothetical protein